MIKGRGHAGITIAARDDFRVWPNFSANERQRSAVFLGAATGKENSCTIDSFWQRSKNFAQAFWGCQAQIRRRQLTLIDNRPLRTGISASGTRSFEYHPCGFCSASFDAK